MNKKLNEEEKLKILEVKRKKRYDETHAKIDNIDHKLCNICEKYFPCTSEFYYKNKLNGIDGFYPYCKKCAVNKATVWKKGNQEKYYKSMKKTSSKQENKEKRRVRNKQPNYKKKQKEWLLKNKDKLREYGKVRRMTKVHEITKQEWEYCLQYFMRSCAYCGISELESIEKYKQKLHKEHVNPDGSNKLENNVPACKSCNASKRVDSLDSWYTSDKLFFLKERYERITEWIENVHKKYIEI